VSAKKSSASIFDSRAAKNKAKISISQLRVKQAHANLRMLLLARPNYLGNLEESSFEPALWEHELQATRLRPARLFSATNETGGLISIRIVAKPGREPGQALCRI
jgi:hypothetical protein